MVQQRQVLSDGFPHVGRCLFSQQDHHLAVQHECVEIFWVRLGPL